MQYELNRIGSSSSLSSDSQATCGRADDCASCQLRIQEEIRVVFPKPAGASTRVSFAPSPLSSWEISRWRGTRARPSGGMYSFVPSRVVNMQGLSHACERAQEKAV